MAFAAVYLARKFVNAIEALNDPFYKVSGLALGIFNSLLKLNSLKLTLESDFVFPT